MTEKELEVILSYIEAGLSDITRGISNRQDTELVNWTVKVYRVGKHYRIDVLDTMHTIEVLNKLV